MLYLLYILLAGFLTSTSGNYLTIAWAKRKQLFESNDHRKTHTEKVSALGGLPIFIAFWVAVLLLGNLSFDLIIPLFSATVLLLGIGLWDDVKNIGVKRRLLIQITVANIAFFSGFHFGFEANNFQIFINYGATIFFVLLLINSINFIDGINGLAGSIGVISFSVMGVLMYLLGAHIFAILSFGYVGALLGFLAYNYGKKAAIFMGDNGSTVLGFLIAIFTMKCTQLSVADMSLSHLPILLGIVSIPVLDLLAVVCLRIFKGKSPFSADRSHIHHILTASGMSHPQACQFVIVWMLAIITIFYINSVTSITIASVLLIGIYSLIRVQYSVIKTPVTSLSVSGKPDGQPTLSAQ